MGIRTLAAWAAATIAFGALTGVGTAQEKYTIGYDIYWVGNSWSVQLYKEFEAEAARHPDKIEEVFYVESELKADKQIANIEDLITKGVDVIITTPISPTALIPVLKKARDKGIKVVLLASTIKSDDYDLLVTVDDVEFGKVGAEWLAGALDGKGKIALRHAGPVIGDANEPQAPARGRDLDPARAGIERILDQFLDDARGPLDDLTRGDAVDEVWRQLTNGHRWARRGRRRDTGASASYPILPPAGRTDRRPKDEPREWFPA